MPICNIKLKATKPSYKPYPPKEDKSLGAELKRKRLGLEWTQQEAANHFGILKDSYQGWEWNERIPHIKNRKMVNEFLGNNYWDDGSDSLANRFLLYRVKHGLTHEELAKRVKVSVITISRIENEKLKTSNFTINKVEKFLEV